MGAARAERRRMGGACGARVYPIRTRRGRWAVPLGSSIRAVACGLSMTQTSHGAMWGRLTWTLCATQAVALILRLPRVSLHGMRMLLATVPRRFFRPLPVRSVGSAGRSLAGNVVRMSRQGRLTRPTITGGLGVARVLRRALPSELPL